MYFILYIFLLVAPDHSSQSLIEDPSINSRDPIIAIAQTTLYHIKQVQAEVYPVFFFLQHLWTELTVCLVPSWPWLHKGTYRLPPLKAWTVSSTPWAFWRMNYRHCRQLIWARSGWMFPVWREECVLGPSRSTVPSRGSPPRRPELTCFPTAACTTHWPEWRTIWRS